MTLPTHLGPEGHKLGVVLVVEVVEGAHVLGVGDEPVDGGEVLALGELLVQPPEHLHYAQRGRRHRVREVATRGRHAAHTHQDTPMTNRKWSGHAVRRSATKYVFSIYLGQLHRVTSGLFTQSNLAVAAVENSTITKHAHFTKTIQNMHILQKQYKTCTFYKQQIKTCTFYERKTYINIIQKLVPSVLLSLKKKAFIY